MKKRDNPDQISNHNLKQCYGITLADYDRMYADQGGLCAICSAHRPARTKTRMYVDHDHKTGKIRALLCNHCNVGLGMFKDDPIILEMARNYLLEHNVTSSESSPVLN